MFTVHSKKGNSVYQGVALPFPTIPENKTYYLNAFETWSYDFAKAYGSAEYAARSFTHMNRFELTAKKMTNKELTQFSEINDNNLISLDRYLPRKPNQRPLHHHCHQLNSVSDDLVTNT